MTSCFYSIWCHHWHSSEQEFPHTKFTRICISIGSGLFEVAMKIQRQSFRKINLLPDETERIGMRSSQWEAIAVLNRMGSARCKTLMYAEKPEWALRARYLRLEKEKFFTRTHWINYYVFEYTFPLSEHIYLILFSIFYAFSISKNFSCEQTNRNTVRNNYTVSHKEHREKWRMHTWSWFRLDFGRILDSLWCNSESFRRIENENLGL